MTKQNEQLLNIGRNIFKQIEQHKDSNVVINSKDAQCLFEYIFWLEKELDKLREEKKPKEENAES